MATPRVHLAGAHGAEICHMWGDATTQGCVAGPGGTQVNAIGPLLVTQAMLRHGLIGSGGPSVVGNVTSKVRERPRRVVCDTAGKGLPACPLVFQRARSGGGASLLDSGCSRRGGVMLRSSSPTSAGFRAALGGGWAVLHPSCAEETWRPSAGGQQRGQRLRRRLRLQGVQGRPQHRCADLRIPAPRASQAAEAVVHPSCGWHAAPLTEGTSVAAAGAQ